MLGGRLEDDCFYVRYVVFRLVLSLLLECCKYLSWPVILAERYRTKAIRCVRSGVANVSGVILVWWNLRLTGFLPGE